MGGGVVIDDQPVPRSGGSLHRAAVDVAAGHRDVAVDLLLQQLEVGVLYHRQVLVVAIGAVERAGFDGLQEHGAAGGKAGAIAL
jgi:hypothetical protein